MSITPQSAAVVWAWVRELWHRTRVLAGHEDLGVGSIWMTAKVR